MFRNKNVSRRNFEIKYIPYNKVLLLTVFLTVLLRNEICGLDLL